MKYLSSIGLFLLLLLNITVYGQYYETGQDPARLKWMQIKTDRFRIIYPESYGNEGIAFANSLENAYSDITKNLYPAGKFKIPVIIHNHTTQANGYVAWAPKRMELYPTPEQNTIPLDHKEQLSFHEMTHVVQMESLKSGFSKGMSYIFGQQYTGALASLLPIWFMEGDAVFTETVLSHSGRGRSPSFLNELKAITIEKGFPWNYDKIINGSFKNHIPNHYQYGYQMIAWSFSKYNLNIWQKAIKTTAQIPFLINPVNISLRKNAGITKKRLFEQTFDSLKLLWQRDISMSNALKYSTVNPLKKGRYINYDSPQYIGTDSVIAIKTSMADPPEIVLIHPSDGKEKKLLFPGSMNPWLISGAKGKVVWTESRMDPRWENQNYSVIRLYDINSGTSRQLTFRSRILAATISSNAELIAAVENKVDNTNNLLLINSSDGKTAESIPSPGNAFLQYPQWSDNNKKITVIYLTQDGEGILGYDLITKTWNVLLEPGYNDLKSVCMRNDSLFFVSSVSGNDEAYLSDLSKRIFKLTSTEFGVSDLSVYGKSILFTSLTSEGNNICFTPINNLREYDNSIHNSSVLAERFNFNPNNTSTDPQLRYTPEPYKKWQHLFNFHSWMPLYADLDKIQTDPASIRPGLTLLSQNNLGSLISSAGYEYTADNRHVFHSKITWKGWYPVIESRFDYNTLQEVSTTNESTIPKPSDIKNGYKFSNSVYIPLHFTSGRFYHQVFPEISVNYTNRYIYVKEANKYDYGQTQITGRLFFSNYSISAVRDLYPRLAQVFDLSYTSAPYDKLIFGSDIALKTAFYFPGIFKNQSLRIRYEIEKQDFAKYLTSNRVRFPRGYENIYSEHLMAFSTEYSIPVLYPDLSITSALYIKRIRTNLFFDYAEGTNNYYFKNVDGVLINQTHTYGTDYFKSYGFDLLADIHLFRIPFPVTTGLQTCWKYNESSPLFKFVFSVDIYGMNIGGSKTRREGI